MDGLKVTPAFEGIAFPPDYKPASTTTRPGLSVDAPPPDIDFTPMEPTQLFDDVYFVGTKMVGSIIIDTHAGLIILDTGCNENDCSLFVNDMKKLGLDPSTIKLILLSHEHIDHYGGTQYLKNQVCPEAKVAMSLIGWNNLQTRPSEMAFSNPRPKSIDIFLVDGQTISLGGAVVDVIFTPGHSPGCLSFIFPVKDNGEPHVAGIMGGTLVPANWNEALLYYSSVDYFREHTRRAGCDVGLRVHASCLPFGLMGVHDSGLEAKMAKLRSRKPGDSNPLILGKEKFETEYLQVFKDFVLARVRQLPPDSMPPPFHTQIPSISFHESILFY